MPAYDTGRSSIVQPLRDNLMARFKEFERKAGF
jgi:hypothetical protein